MEWTRVVTCMSSSERDPAGAVVRLHEPVPKEKRTALNVHTDVREEVRKVRDSINEAAGTDLVTQNDVIRLSLLTLGRLSEVSEEGTDALTEEEADVLIPLMDHVRIAADPQVLGANVGRDTDETEE